jgi:hypothetical protein
MLAYMNHGKTNMDNDRKRSWYLEKGCFGKSQNYFSRTEYRLEDLVSTKLYDVSFTNPTSTAGLQLLNF